MSALIALFNTENDALVESVFVDSCFDLVSNLDDDDIDKINEYVTLLDNKQTKEILEQEISEALVMVMEHNAALYGTFLYESVDEEIDEESAKTMLENIRSAFGREFVMEALSDKAKSRLKTAGKIGAGAAALGAAGYAAYKGNDGFKAGVDSAVDKVGNVVHTGKNKLTSLMARDGKVSSGEAARTGDIQSKTTNVKNSWKRPSDRLSMVTPSKGH
jgi:hypothetical protein